MIILLQQNFSSISNFCNGIYLKGSEIPLKQINKEQLQGLIFGATLHAAKQTNK